MKLSVLTRALGVAAVSASMVGMPLAMKESAVTQPGKCTKLTTKQSGSNILATVSGCTPTSATGGKGSGTFKAGQTSGSLAASLKWATNYGTTKASVKLTPQTAKGRCPAGTTRIKVTGSVTGGTGAAGRLFKKGQPVTGSVCANTATGNASLEPGTALKF